MTRSIGTLTQNVFIIREVCMTEKIIMTSEDTETTINYNKFTLGDWAEVYTTDKTIMKRFEKFCQKHPDYAKLVKEDKYSMTFSVHSKCASLYPRAPRKVNMTEEKLEELRNRFKH